MAWTLLVLAGLQVVLAVWIEWRKPEIRDPEYGGKLIVLHALQAREPDRPLFLALGSSRTLNGFRPELLSGLAPAGQTEPIVFNFGLTSHSPLHQLAAFNRLLNDGVRPRWMLIEVTPSFLPIEVSASTMVDASKQAWSDLPALMKYERWSPALYAEWFESRAVPWFAHRYALTHQYAPRWLPPNRTEFRTLAKVTDHGWLPLPKPKSDEEYRRRVEAAKKDHAGTLHDFAVSSLADAALRELLARCRDLGIPTALVLTPEGGVFRGWYGPDTNRRLDEFLGRLRADFAVPVVDAREWVADEHFWDGHHLLPEGAAIYTQRLGRELIARMLQQKH